MTLQISAQSIEKMPTIRQGKFYLFLTNYFFRKGVVHNFSYCLFLGFHEIFQNQEANADEFLRISELVKKNLKINDKIDFENN